MYKPKVLLIGEQIGCMEQIRQHLDGYTCQPQDIYVRPTLSEAANQSDEIPDLIMLPLALYPSAQHSLKQLSHRLAYRPIIIIAGKTEEEKALKAVASGATDYIIPEETNAQALQKTVWCAMARSSANYRQIFNESPAPMYIYDKKSLRFLSANKACRRQYGYSEDEFLSMTAEQVRHEDDVPLFLNISKIAPEEYHDYGRWRHRRKNGDTFIVHIYAGDIQFDSKPARLVTAVDVSNIVSAEQEVLDKNEEVNNILESITDGFFALNMMGEFTYVNKECENIFGFRREEMIGKNIWDIYNKDEYAEFYSQYQQTADKRINMCFEGYVNEIGKWLSVTAYPTKNGLAVYLVDVTERRQIRQKLYNDEQKLRAIINNTSDMIWLLNRERQIIIGNNAFRKWIKQGNENTDTLPASLALNWKEHFDMAFGGQPLTFTAMETKGDSLFYQEVSLYPVRSEADEVMSISCFARDVTEQQLRIQKIQLQNQYLEKIAWMHSHEARGPVANILGLANLFEMNDPADPDNRMMMELIIESSQQLDKVIRKIVADIDTYQLNYRDEE